ncbi:DUF3304 domain-containing protein [Pseudoduganella sp. HUAS MS19]
MAVKKVTSILIPILSSILLLTACKEHSVPAGIRGFNHTKDMYIYNYTVNGAMGADIEPETGGGTSSCCISLPAIWRPGLRMKISWEYGRIKEGDPKLPPQMVEVEVPKYGESAGDLHVHFYGGNRVKVLVSRCLPEHPFYPMDAGSLLPWKANSTKEEYLKWKKKVGKGHGC